MFKPFKRKRHVYEDERQHLLVNLAITNPITDEYKILVARLDEIDRLLNRTTELKKTVIPALGTIGGVAGIYGLQQFAGVIVPKALDAIAARQEQKRPKDRD